MEYLCQSGALVGKMKILYLSKARIPSQTANSVHIMKMCQAFASEGNQVHLCCVKDDIDGDKSVYEYYNVNENFKIHYLSSSNIFYLLKLFFLLIVERPKLVYGRFLHGCSLSAFLGFKTTLEVHSLGFASTKLSKKSFMYLLGSNRLQKIISITKSLKKDLIDLYSISNESIKVFADGADKVEEIQVNKPLKNYDGELQIGYVGSMHEGKGVDIVIKLSHLLPNLNFHIVGGKEEQVNKLRKENKNENLFFYGHLSQKLVFQYMNDFDICLLPNKQNVLIDNQKKSNIGKYTSPLKMFEYMSLGKAIIASDLDVIKEVLTESNSILASVDNIDSWIESINMLKSQEKRQIIGNNAKKDFLTNYTWNKRVQGLLKVINE